MTDEEQDFKMGFILDAKHTTRLMQLCAMSGETPHTIITSAIDRIWQSFAGKE